MTREQDINKELKDYKKNKGKIEVAEERCRYWQECLDTMGDDEIAREFENTPPDDRYGMPKAKDNNSPVEGTLVNTEVTREMVKQWIKDDQSRIKPLKFKIEQLDIALGSLDEKEHYIIDCKCIDGWKWWQVEIGYNEKFKTEIQESRLKQIKIQAISKLKAIIN
jgi:hypothetical protein